MLHVLPPEPHRLEFPPVDQALPEGLLAVGGDLQPARLLAAYRRGIFPWYSTGQPILWWSPDPRAVLFPERLKVSRSLAKTLRQGRYTLTLDTRFREVITACAAPRPGARGTWITPEMQDAYVRLHELGHAHSVEAWLDGQLVGGLYGVALGGVFFGESMFSRASDASKVPFVHLVRQLAAWGFELVDCQVASDHLFTLGAEEIPRPAFLRHLDRLLTRPDRPGPWRFEAGGRIESSRKATP